MSGAMSLNEIVNLPGEFQASTPHIVVQYVDWIQCRYLFIRVADNKVDEQRDSSATTATQYIDQDPHYTPKGANRKPIGIPRSAFPVSRKLSMANEEEGQPRSANEKGGLSKLVKTAELYMDVEDEEDMLFLLSDGEHQATEHMPPDGGKSNGKGKGKRVEDLSLS
jgi:ubiquitin-conjugating enzyme E2 Q